MKNTILVLSAVSLMFGSSSSFAGPCDKDLIGGGATSSRTENKVNKFTERILTKIIEADSQTAKASENLFITGPALATALTLVANGAGQKAQQELLAALGYNPGEIEQLNRDTTSLMTLLNRGDAGTDIKTSNVFFADRKLPVLPSYIQGIKSHFKADVGQLDFRGDPEGSANQINSWVKSVTDGQISQIVTPDKAAELVALLASAITFKGSWETQFDENQTMPGRFKNESGEEVYPEMMNATVAKLEAVRAKDGSYMIARLPYAGRTTSMYLILPMENWQEKIPAPRADVALLSALRSGDLSRFQAGDVQVFENEDISLPKFVLQYSNDQLKKVLEAMGVQGIFSGGNLLEMSKDPRLYVNYVQLDTALEVNEQGAKAAGVASVGFALESMQMKTFEFNRSFGVVIRDDKSGVDLFSGVIRKLKSK